MPYIGQAPTTTAFLTDQFSGNGSTTAFTMSVAPATTTSVLVSITGVLQDPTTYSVSGTTLTFSAAPPTGTGNISVRYLGIPASGVTTTAYRTITEFTATAGQTTFTPASYTVGFINVYRNGVLLGSADYTASNGTTVVLTSAASSGDLVTTESFYVSSVLNAIPATAGAVNSNYITNGAVTQAKLGANVAGNGPAFSAYGSALQSVSNTTFTKVAYNTEEFDTASCYDTTLYRFTPNVAGYYQINSTINQAGTASNFSFIQMIWKNGSRFKDINQASTQYVGAASGNCLIYLNGSTDYIEVYVWQNTGGAYNMGSNNAQYAFSGSLVRAA